MNVNGVEQRQAVESIRFAKPISDDTKASGKIKT